MSRGSFGAAASLGAAALLACAPGAAAAERGDATCDPEAVFAGEWRTYGHDQENTRHQPREHLITAADAPLLTPDWTFSTTRAGGTGDVVSTPVVAGQCLYVATTRGWLFALNADTGGLVWRARLPYGGSVWSTVTAAHGRIYAGISRTTRQEGCPAGDPCIGPYMAAFDERTGEVEWATASLDEQPGSDTYGSPVLFPEREPPARTIRTRICRSGSRAARARCTRRHARRCHRRTRTGRRRHLRGSGCRHTTTRRARGLPRPVAMMGISGGAAETGDETDRYAFQGSMVFVDADDGEVLRKTWTIHAPPNAPDDQFAGGGIWSTPAVDAERRVAYVGTSNPFRPQAEHRLTNSVVRYDIDRSSARFGEITGSYKGNIDEYVPFLSQLPCYDIPGNPFPWYPSGLGSCGDIDLDFGASPNLFTDSSGRRLVGAGQKSGVYHVFDADSMEPVWSQIVGPPTGGVAVGGIVGSTAYDGGSFYGPITVPGYVWSISARNGAYRWVGPIADGLHWGPPVAVANGVVYSVDLTGFLDAFDARTGMLVAKRPMILGGSRIPTASWAGVSVARHRIYAAVGIRGLSEGYVVAFRPGAPSDVGEDLGETIGNLEGGGGGGGGGGGSGSTSIVAGPGAYTSTYLTPRATTRVGGQVTLYNYDVALHDVTSDEPGPDGAPLFNTELIGFNQTAQVRGLDRVQAGRDYGFFCSIHPGMRGTLSVR